MKRNELKMPISSILRRGHYLYFLFYYLYGMAFDIKIAGKSMNGTLFNHQEGIYAVQCISYPYLRQLQKEIVWTDQDIFVDVGCAWGRLLGYLEKTTKIQKLIGVEINPDVASFASNAFANNDRIDILCGDITQVIPTYGTIFYLFNPFDENVFSSFLDTIEEKVDHPVRLLYLYPTCRKVIDSRTRYWRLIREVELSPRHLSPLVLCEYEYCPNTSKVIQRINKTCDLAE